MEEALGHVKFNFHIWPSKNFQGRKSINVMKRSLRNRIGRTSIIRIHVMITTSWGQTLFEESRKSTDDSMVLCQHGFNQMFQRTRKTIKTIFSRRWGRGRNLRERTQVTCSITFNSDKVKLWTVRKSWFWLLGSSLFIPFTKLLARRSNLIYTFSTSVFFNWGQPSKLWPRWPQIVHG